MSAGRALASARPPAAATDQALRIRVRGVVQGVGFRPFVHRLATAMGLSGTVWNDGEGVVIEVAGAGAHLLAERIRAERPALSRIDSLEVEPCVPPRDGPFSIRATGAGGAGGALIPADVAPCPACVAEFRDPANRRFGYVFTNCTDCGPRYTITRSLPFDRERTAMAAFPMCAACDGEYRDPASRRFHAQTNCCPACGPALSMAGAEASADVVADVAGVLRAGGIVALKGLGGFHLACHAADGAAVTALRTRKRRDFKPLAVMVRDIGAARRLAIVRPEEAAVLESRERPVAIVEARPENGIDPSVAAGLPTLGLMLPSTLLQQALIDAAGGIPLVMTSANISGEPVIIDDGEARSRLAGIADRIVTHDRPIVARADDSVVKVIAGVPAFLRRARGAAPAPIRLSAAGPDVLALGGHLKAAACVLRGDAAFLTPHVGDLDHPAAVAALEAAALHVVALCGARPVAVAHDLHPDFASTLMAERLSARLGLRRVAVQHHHAHALAIAAEHGLARRPFIAVTLDGFGLGAGREAWGGEILAVRGAAFDRVAHLAPIGEPGGDIAAREPWRVAAALLASHRRGGEIAARFAAEPAAEALARLLAGTAPVARTSSAGRWFDAAAALAGAATRNRFEGEAAMRFEALCTAPEALPGGWVADGDAIDLWPVLEAVAELGHLGRPGRASDLFHGTMIDALATVAQARAEAAGTAVVALGGGCLANRPLAEGLEAALRRRGLTPIKARAAPANDGGLALGQAMAARLMLDPE